MIEKFQNVITNYVHKNNIFYRFKFEGYAGGIDGLIIIVISIINIV